MPPVLQCQNLVLKKLGPCTHMSPPCEETVLGPFACNGATVEWPRAHSVSAFRRSNAMANPLAGMTHGRGPEGKFISTQNSTFAIAVASLTGLKATMRRVC
jgi:hypothetical protein